MKMKFAIGICVSILFFSGNALAHYGMVIPSDSMVLQGENKKISITFSFSHPFEKHGMNLERPKTVQVFTPNGKESLKRKLKKTNVMEHKAWKTLYNINRPGIYQFVMEPEPYWEPAEDCFIIHYTKTVVTAFEDDEGWDKEIGLKTEIVPLSKPFGLYAGNLFQGIVKLNGKPVPYAEVEVEFYNENGKSHAPTPYMITQTIKADKNGVFSYAVPKAGWWGFAALNTADFKLRHNGQKKDVELGAVIWVKFHDWQKK